MNPWSLVMILYLLGALPAGIAYLFITIEETDWTKSGWMVAAAALLWPLFALMIATTMVYLIRTNQINFK